MRGCDKLDERQISWKDQGNLGGEALGGDPVKAQVPSYSQCLRLFELGQVPTNHRSTTVMLRPSSTSIRYA